MPVEDDVGFRVPAYDHTTEVRSGFALRYRVCANHDQGFTTLQESLTMTSTIMVVIGG